MTEKETRNIIDHYHYWTHDAILADLSSKAFPFSVLCSNLGQDFNLSTCLRNSQAFCATEFIIYGRKRYDRRGTVGAHNYTKIRFFAEADLDNLKDYLSSKLVIGIDNIPGSEPIDSYSWDYNKHTVLAFGQEQIGLPQEIINISSKILYIKQYGATRSLNVG